jgi:2-polyprenyl-6-methoxyphenol hydroxylase-like FAD-dependent oxidoreductase
MINTQRTALVLAIVALAVALTSAGLLVRWDNRRDSEVASLQRRIDALNRTVASQRPYVRAVEGICLQFRGMKWPTDGPALEMFLAVIVSCSAAEIPRTKPSKQ